MTLDIDGKSINANKIIRWDAEYLFKQELIHLQRISERGVHTSHQQEYETETLIDSGIPPFVAARSFDFTTSTQLLEEWAECYYETMLRLWNKIKEGGYVPLEVSNITLKHRKFKQYCLDNINMLLNNGPLNNHRFIS